MKGDYMRQEKINEVIEKVAAGNPRMKALAKVICVVAEDKVRSMGDSKTELLKRRVVKAASGLTRREISVHSLEELGEEYWQTERGMEADVGLREFWQRKLGKRRNLG